MVSIMLYVFLSISLILRQLKIDLEKPNTNTDSGAHRRGQNYNLGMLNQQMTEALNANKKDRRR